MTCIILNACLSALIQFAFELNTWNIGAVRTFSRQVIYDAQTILVKLTIRGSDLSWF